MIFCEQCGTKLEDDALFCSECGARVSEASAAPISDSTEYLWLQLITGCGEETATTQSVRAALSAAAADEDEYAKLSPVIPGRDTVSVLAYCQSGEIYIQIIINERGDKYDVCYEKGGFALEQACDIFLNYAESKRLPADYPGWAQL